MMKFNYTDEQRKAVKNLKVSASILRSDIKDLTAALENPNLAEAERTAIETKIAYKTERAEAKEAAAKGIQDSVGKTEVAVIRKEADPNAPAKPKKAKKAKPEAEATPVSEEM